MARYGDLDNLALKWMLASPKQRETFRQIIDEHPTADVVPKSEVEQLKEDVERLKDDNEYLQDKVFKVRIEVAREIFEEIEQIIEKCKYQQATPFGTEERYNPYVIIKRIAELKKKYMEGDK